MANGTRKPMRQGQQNRRGRGRGRKVQNNISRSLESNGPDVKIRGTAAHIAEKYATLARDSLSAGDTVAGESYLQHAEHYNRIIMANQQAQAENANGSGQPRERANGGDDSGDDDSGDEQQADDAPQAETSSGSDKPDEVTEDDGIARTMARTVRRKSGNGAKSGDNDEADSEPSDAGDEEESKDEAVT